MSLSGKSKSRTQETKQDFLERTRREREARETQRRREKAALDVQVLRCRLQAFALNHVVFFHGNLYGCLIFIFVSIDRPF